MEILKNLIDGYNAAARTKEFGERRLHRDHIMAELQPGISEINQYLSQDRKLSLSISHYEEGRIDLLLNNYPHAEYIIFVAQSSLRLSSCNGAGDEGSVIVQGTNTETIIAAIAQECGRRSWLDTKFRPTKSPSM